MSDIKPCPFCGDIPMFYGIEFDENPEDAIMSLDLRLKCCMDHMIYERATIIEDATKERLLRKAVEKWNKRAEEE